MLDRPPRVRPAAAELEALGHEGEAEVELVVPDLRAKWAEDKRWLPQLDASTRERQYAMWKKAVTRTFDWVEEDA